MSEKRDLIVAANALPAAIKQRMEVAEFIGDTLERRDIQAFFREFPELFINCLERHYPLDAELLEQFSDIWDWQVLSWRNDFSWTPKFIERFQKYWVPSDLMTHSRYDCNR